MTTFLLSHNLQLQSPSVPPWEGMELAEGLQRLCSHITSAEVLSHPHWRIRIEASVDPFELARELVEGWGLLRSEYGHDVDHSILALGGRKDTPSAPGSPLEPGAWGVDIVETADAKGFLEAINWEGLKASRPVDGVFEVERQPC
jgi:hypothetical protein